MSVAPNPTQTNLDHARRALADVVAGREELERFLERLFDEWEQLAGQWKSHRQAMMAQNADLEERLRRRADDLERQQATIEEQKQRIREEIRREVAAATAELAEAMVEQRRQITEERTRWLEELTRMRQLLELGVRRDTRTKDKQMGRNGTD